MTEHRLVVRPAWHGLRMGNRLPEEVARRLVPKGDKYAESS